MLAMSGPVSARVGLSAAPPMVSCDRPGDGPPMGAAVEQRRPGKGSQAEAQAAPPCSCCAGESETQPHGSCVLTKTCAWL